MVARSPLLCAFLLALGTTASLTYDEHVAQYYSENRPAGLGRPFFSQPADADAMTRYVCVCGNLVTSVFGLVSSLAQSRIRAPSTPSLIANTDCRPFSAPARHPTCPTQA